MITDCVLSNANISGADLGLATVKDTVSGLSTVSYDTKTRFNIRSENLPSGLPKALIDRINGDYRRYQDKRKRSVAGKVWAKATNHSRNAWPILIPIALVYGVFAAIYTWFLYLLKRDVFAWQSEIPKALFLSSEAMLGIDPSTEVGDNALWRAIFHTQAAFSLLLLALLIAIVTHKTTAPAVDA